MNISPEHLKSFLPLLTGAAEGKQVQTLTDDGDGNVVWEDVSLYEVLADMLNGMCAGHFRIKPEKRTATFWVNLYADGDHKLHKDKKSANKVAGSARLACVQVTVEYEEGEGL